jgi:hypothetical protein
MDNTNGKLSLLIDESLAYALRKTISVTSQDATPDISKPGGYGPRKVGTNFYFPKQTADLKYFTNQVRILGDFHPETTNAEIDTYFSIIAAYAVDADFSGLRYYGSKA